jgi:hypothetical protein
VAQTFYRIILGPSATRHDFLSNRALGRVLRRSTPETLRTYDGVSVFETSAQARAAAIRFPMLGTHMAELVIPKGAAIHIERTFAKQPGHHTVWGSPDELLGYVRRILSISDEEQEHEHEETL